MRTKRNNHQKHSREPAKLPEAPVDYREQLCNGGKIGPITHVQLSADEITSLQGIMLDLDPSLFRREIVPDTLGKNPKEFYQQIVSKWLSRHPVLSKAEVRSSGRGLHAILRFDQPLEFYMEGERDRWSAVVRVLQKLLPTDPNAPGITALTRPIGSINGKNGKKVTCLHKGQRSTVGEITSLFDEVRKAPFRTVATILFGSDHVAPCPICHGEQSRLEVLDHVGKCYGNCGKIRFGQLYDVFLEPQLKQGS
jgi:hypothetical protein